MERKPMNTASNANNDQVQKHIDLVGREFLGGCVSRPIAASIGISENVLDPDDLYAFVEYRIDFDVQSGYWEEGQEDEDEPQDEDAPFFGYGVSIPSFEAYLALNEHFGDNWLEETIISFEMARSGHSRDKVLTMVDRCIGRAWACYAGTVNSYVTRKMMKFLADISSLMGELPHQLLRRAA
jgi:hypothetical protein